MTQPRDPKNAAEQPADAMMACALSWMRMLLPDAQSLHILPGSSLWRAQSEILQGLLRVTERQLDKLDPDPPASGEKILVD
jgi:hypothetical protein